MTMTPTDEQRYSVETMAGIGIPQDSIALALGISLPTLRKHFRAELDCGKVRTITKVADSLVRQALAGNITAAIFYLKTQAGWREVAKEEEDGKKEQRAKSARKAATGRFAPPPAPRLAVDNTG